MSIVPNENDKFPKWDKPISYELPSKVESIYPKEAVEHLVDQLIKLNETYDVASRTGYDHQKQLIVAMETINDAIERALTTELTLNKKENV